MNKPLVVNTTWHYRASSHQAHSNCNFLLKNMDNILNWFILLIFTSSLPQCSSDDFVLTTIGTNNDRLPSCNRPIGNIPRFSRLAELLCSSSLPFIHSFFGGHLEILSDSYCFDVRDLLCAMEQVYTAKWSTGKMRR